MSLQFETVRTADALRVPAPQLQSVSASGHAEVSLESYIDGWAAGDVEHILEVAAEDYTFRDPLVGTFDHTELADYFSILRARLMPCSEARRPIPVILRIASAAAARRVRCCRELPEAGLEGFSDITFDGSKIAHEVVCYEPNLASECLRNFGKGLQ